MINEMKQGLAEIQIIADLFGFLHPDIYCNVDDNVVDRKLTLSLKHLHLTCQLP